MIRILKSCSSFGGDILITQTPLGPTTLMNIIAKVDNQTKVENIMIESFAASAAEIEQKLKSQIEQCREWVGLRPAGGFLSCPDEVLMRIVNKLNAKSLIALGATCVKLRLVFTYIEVENILQRFFHDI